MKETKLISMLAFIKEQNKLFTEHDNPDTIVFNLLNYADFLSKPLELGMFVPCKDGVTLEEPKQEDYTKHYELTNLRFYKSNKEEYQQAKEAVLFERKNIPRLQLIKTYSDMNFTIEFLVPRHLTLTESAVKLIQ